MLNKLISGVLGKTVTIVLLVFILLLILLALARAREDYWVKDNNGNWTKHGNPAENKPIE